MVFQGTVPLGYDIKHFRETGETTKEKREVKQKPKKKKKKQSLEKRLSKKITAKRILKPSKATVTIKEKTPENIFHDENRFFKGELNRAKQDMFFE